MGLCARRRPDASSSTEAANLDRMPVLPEEKDTVQWLPERTRWKVHQLQQDEPGMHFPASLILQLYGLHPSLRSSRRRSSWHATVRSLRSAAASRFDGTPSPATLPAWSASSSGR